MLVTCVTVISYELQAGAQITADRTTMPNNIGEYIRVNVWLLPPHPLYLIQQYSPYDTSWASNLSANYISIYPRGCKMRCKRRKITFRLKAIFSRLSYHIQQPPEFIFYTYNMECKTHSTQKISDSHLYEYIRTKSSQHKNPPQLNAMNALFYYSFFSFHVQACKPILI